MSPEGGDGPVAALALRGISKRFGDTVALEGADLVVRPGTVHALLGENGAGKTTLMRIAYGLLRPDAGDIAISGSAVGAHTVRAGVDAGLGMVHQHLSLVPNLTAAENFALGGRGRFAPSKAAVRLRAISVSSGLLVPADAPVRELSIVEQQRLEILKALGRRVRVLILDEPTAVLAPAETDELLRWIREFALGGGSVVLVTHKLREALAVADRITVLRRGRVVQEGPARGASAAALARAIFPDSEEATPAPIPASAGAVVVAADGLSVADARGTVRLRGATFQAGRHEIVGIAAVEGSGHRELLLALARLRRPLSGTLTLPPRIAIIPADRARDALIPDFTLTENVALHDLGRRRGWMPWRELQRRTAQLVERFSVTAPSPGTPARELSGGNQQRLVVARELASDADLVIADNPTRGLDIRATAFVHDRLRAAAADGAAVVVHSSDVDEVLSLATRILVVFEGGVREVRGDRTEIGRAMLGAG